MCEKISPQMLIDLVIDGSLRVCIMGGWIAYLSGLNLASAGACMNRENGLVLA